MKLYLFGGAETQLGQVDPLIHLINQVILDIKPNQLLHVPYARLKVPKGEENFWGEGWVRSKLNLKGIELLDARIDDDLSRALKPVVFINGGPERKQLIDTITLNKRLNGLILNADYLIGESAGSMVVGEYQRDFQGIKTVIIKGLGILKSTIIEPHYTERGRHQALRNEMKESNAQYGIGIDSVTGIVIDTDKYPDDYKVIGNGLVEFVYEKDLK